MKKSLFVAVALLLSACGSAQGGLDGTYSDARGINSYTFKPGGKVIASAFIGPEVELDYTVEDGKVKIAMPQGALLMTIVDDGAALMVGGQKLIKQKELDGTYSDENLSFAFEPRGKVLVGDGSGTQIGMEYTVEDGKVEIAGPQGVLLLTIVDDGAALTAGGKKLIKQ